MDIDKEHKIMLAAEASNREREQQAQVDFRSDCCNAPFATKYIQFTGDNYYICTCCKFTCKALSPDKTKRLDRDGRIQTYIK